MIETKTFASSSSTATYIATRDTDTGATSCTCPGWRNKRANQARGCKHTKAWAAETPVTTAPVVVPPAIRRLVTPMLASAMTTPVTGIAFDAQFATGWRLEQKLDGHRVLVTVEGGAVHAWSRAGNARTLDAAMVAALAHLPEGTYDGELCAQGGMSSDVTRIGADLVLVLFDVLHYYGQNVMAVTYAERRKLLLDCLRRLPYRQTVVSTVESTLPTWAGVEAIWAAGGEGVILKHVNSRYHPGQRSDQWLKVKQGGVAVGTITGFVPGENGPHSVITLTLGSGVSTRVKTLNQAMLRDIAANPTTYLGARLVISHKGLLASGKPRHPMCDHLAADGE